MRCPLDARPGRSPAWKRLLLTGILIASCTCLASSELPFPASPDLLTEGAGARLPVPGSLNGVLSASWPQGHSHTGQETLDTRASSNRVSLFTFPYNIDGVIQSDLNYSVVLNCLASYITPKPVLHWTFNGEPYMTGALLIIRRLSWENLGTYVCTAKNSQGQYPSDPVTISLPEEKVDPTEAEPIEPDPVLSLSGGAAISLLVAGNVGAAMLIGGISFTIVQSLKARRQRIRMCC
ncbi:immunoglobulin superfamily member 23 isoform X1 [Vulpes vulpes]|uniref:immunoglobulin superfamily member 23 isoform X1 n=1 Tax=Vulpes vulpes TaxID=9627 RepID=UPI000DF6E730|nr:immunoglobulin superfamily member 23 isoform X1 [Vulpes vulpes]